MININIDVSVKNRIASLTDDAEIVCGNADYVINFDFNEELSEAEEKTARFIFDDNVVDLKFTGNSCCAPIVSNSRELIIGVFTESYATTYIRIPCRFSALCEDVTGIDAEPQLFPNYEKQIAELNAIAKTHSWFQSAYITPKNVLTIFKNNADFTEIPPIDTSMITSFGSAFDSCVKLKTIPLIDTSNGMSFENMFHECEALEQIPLIDTSNGTNFKQMFYNCETLKEIPLLDVSNGTTLYAFCRGCRALEKVSKLNSKNSTSFSYAFYQCSNLKTIESVDFSKATSVSSMFTHCNALENIDVEGLISITVDFKYSTKLTVESAKNILKALTNYAGTSNENKYTIYFASEVWELLNAEGNTAPDGGTWKDYTVSLGWNV